MKKFSCIKCSKFHLIGSDEDACGGSCDRLKAWERQDALKQHQCVWFAAAHAKVVERRAARLHSMIMLVASGA